MQKLPSSLQAVGAAVAVGQGDSVVPEGVEVRRQETGVAVEVQGLPETRCYIVALRRVELYFSCVLRYAELSRVVTEIQEVTLSTRDCGMGC